MSTALITGASAGLGVDFAKILAGMKFDLILVARNEERMRSLVGELTQNYGIQCRVIALDLAKQDSAQSLFEQVGGHSHQIDILINNAGCGVSGPFAAANPEAISQMLQLNINTLTDLTRLFLPNMLRRNSGRILNVASTAGFLPGPWMAAYYASKSYVISLGEALSVETSKTNVTVSTLCPGPTKTEFFERAGRSISGFKLHFFRNSFDCATVGIDGMFKGKVLIIDGWINFMFVQCSRILPRFVLRQISGAINN
jgi:short-subunit dehydrogenase